MELKHFELFLDGERLDSVWFEGEKLWPADPEPREVRTVLIDDSPHYYNLVAWEYMREQGMVDGEYEATDHLAWIDEHVPVGSELDVAIIKWRAGLTELLVIPDTSQATDLSSLFVGFQSLTTVPPMDTSNVTDMSRMFSGCGSLTTVPDLDARRVQFVDDMFFECASLTDGNVRLIVNEEPSTRYRFNNPRSGSGLTRMPYYLPDGTPL